MTFAWGPPCYKTGVRRSLLSLAILAGPAHADNSSVHATVAGDVAGTDNVFAAADNRQPDVFMQIRPGVLFAYDAPRMIQELNAELEFLEYVNHSNDPSLSGRAGWRGFFTPGPRSEALLSGNVGTGRLNALTTRTGADQTGITVTPAGSNSFRSADANEYLSWVSSKDTRASETSFVRWLATTDNMSPATTTESFELGGTLGFERSFRSDTFSLDPGGSYLRLNRNAAPGVMPGSYFTRQLNPRASVTWRHDIDRQWSTNVDGGAVYVNPISGDATVSKVFPTFGGLVAYTEAWGRATLTARRSVAPNLFLAQNTVDDVIISQLALPLPWLDENPHLRSPKVVALGSFGLERTQLIDPTSSALIGQFDVARLDGGLAYTPYPGQTYGIRYEFVYQHGDSATMMPTASYTRNTLYFTFSIRYPDRVAAQVPHSTHSVRSDRKDLAPVGAEPVIPDPSEPQEGGDPNGDAR